MEEKEQRVKAFKEKVWNWVLENDPEHKEYPIWLLKEFVAHWVTIPDGGRKFYFETQKKWSTGGRLATWKSNSQSWHPKKWQQSTGKPSIDVPIKMKPVDLSSYPKIDYEAYKRNQEQDQRGTTGTLGNILKKRLHGNNNT